MIDYLQAILPRIQNKSKKLDQIEMFVEKPWVLIDNASNEQLEYEFFRDGRLLVSRGGNAAWGKWELAPSSHRLILEYGDKLLLLQTSFLDEAVMIVQKSGMPNSTLVFVNQKKIPDLMFKNYLDKLIQLEDLVKSNSKRKSLTDAETYGDSARSRQIAEVKREKEYKVYSSFISLNSNGDVSGFVWSGKEKELYLRFENGKPTDEPWYVVDEKNKNGDTFSFLTPHKGVILDKSHLIKVNEDTEYEWIPRKETLKTFNGDLSLKIDPNGTVSKVKTYQSEIFIFIVLLIMVLIIAFSV
ncbi:hypothetical protein A33Q_0172 [Indibacter alkaliphilus LW1]|uniref:Uncharacterized protein n=1 Tax=Indibacter alkaliphilus (strain CCUG 57479 / KCTC 22604 / LW1) TaxID=1189612 RepID=S2ECD4_INDAL|nr:hypothetical protein [Indibacter alkaliphilus]EPA00004.1 hypothetical protein A33Q_0172 [Indibacter alkaliphilus LW1]